MATYKLKRRVFAEEALVEGAAKNIGNSVSKSGSLFNVWGNVKNAVRQSDKMALFKNAGNETALARATTLRNAALGKAALGTALIGGAAWGVNKLMGGGSNKYN